MLDWLREVFFGLNAILGYLTLFPITIGGALMAWFAARASNVRQRILVSLGIAIIVTTAIFSILAYMFIDRIGDALNAFLPAWIDYPYLNLAPLVFIWIPITWQLIYVNKSSAPHPWISARIGAVVTLAGFFFILFGAIIVGAEMD